MKASGQPVVDDKDKVMRHEKPTQRRARDARSARCAGSERDLPVSMFFLCLAMLVAPAGLAQTCADPLPLHTLPFGQSTIGNTCDSPGSLPMTPHPVVFHSFHGGPHLAGHFSFSANFFHTAELLLIDGRGGTPPCGPGIEIMQIIAPGESLDIGGLPSSVHYLAVTSFEPVGKPVACGEYAIGHWTWEVDEIFVAGFEPD